VKKGNPAFWNEALLLLLLGHAMEEAADKPIDGTRCTFNLAVAYLRGRFGLKQDIPLGDGPQLAISNSFGFGGHNAVVAFASV
jgi:hypothetical protein